MGDKIRVYQLAKELGLANKELVDKLQALGFEVKSHSSSVDEADARKAIAGGVEPAKADAPAPRRVRTVLRRRSDRDDEAEATEGQENEAAIAVEAEAEVETEAQVQAEDVSQDEVSLPSPQGEDGVAEVVAQETEPAETQNEAAPIAEVQAEAVEPAPPAVEAGAEVPVSESTPVVESAPVPPAPVPKSNRPASQVSKVVRIIDAEAIKQRLASEGKNFQPRRPPAPRFPQVRELHVVQDQFGRGPTMVDVSAQNQRPSKKGKKGGTQETVINRRDMLEMRAGARDLWLTPGKKRRATKKGQKTEITQMAAHKRVVEVPGTITVGDLAKAMATKAGEVLRKLMGMGMMVTINQTIDYDTAAIIATEFEYEAKNVAFEEENLLETTEDKPEDLASRAPVVTIMGHVDHGKTSLLDGIRHSRVVDGEAGGITQHIGAYSVEMERGRITFLDTPGHEAFTAMRARGAQITDLVVLVVAADDGVMPQTVEAINHAKAAKVPIIVAVNKVDKPDANPDRVMQSLTEHALVSEAWGGDTMFVNVSAKKHTGIEDLLEGILLQAEVLDLKSNPSKPSHGTIVEAQLDKGRGPVATVLIQEGTLKTGDSVVSGDFYGRVRALYDDRGTQVEEAGPSTPVQVLGLCGVPNAGDSFDTVADEKTAKTIAEHRAQKHREQELAQSAKVSLETFLLRAKANEALELKLIVKADVQGSVEAVADALTRLTNNQVKVVVQHSAVGAISEGDVNMATASEAIIIGFGVRPDTKALQLAEKAKVDIRLYNIIYEAVDAVKAAMEGKLPTTTIEKYLGRAEIRQTFSVPKVGTVAGCSVIDGKLQRNARIRLLRDGKVLFDGKLSSLKRFKDDVREVNQGYECGAGIDGYNDLKPADLIEAYELLEIATKLEETGTGSGGGDRPQPSA
ncbi:MAG: translation initiation factor IF-2 [Pseudomonadota bacterium]